MERELLLLCNKQQGAEGIFFLLFLFIRSPNRFYSPLACSAAAERSTTSLTYSHAFPVLDGSVSLTLLPNPNLLLLSSLLPSIPSPSWRGFQSNLSAFFRTNRIGACVWFKHLSVRFHQFVTNASRRTNRIAVCILIQTFFRPFI